jgi:hypothetical protein
MERFKRCRLSSVVRRRRRRRRRPSSVPIEFPRKHIIYIAALGRYHMSVLFTDNYVNDASVVY